MFIWTKPVVKVLSMSIDKTLTIESSLYASGCHQGMHFPW